MIEGFVQGHVLGDIGAVDREAAGKGFIAGGCDSVRVAAVDQSDRDLAIRTGGILRTVDGDSGAGNRAGAVGHPDGGSIGE